MWVLENAPELPGGIAISVGFAHDGGVEIETEDLNFPGLQFREPLAHEDRKRIRLLARRASGGKDSQSAVTASRLYPVWEDHLGKRLEVLRISEKVGLADGQILGQSASFTTFLSEGRNTFAILCEDMASGIFHPLPQTACKESQLGVLAMQPKAHGPQP